MVQTSAFQDVLGEQLRRAPYLVASIFAHCLLAFLIAGIMVLQSREEVPPPQLVAAAPPPPPDVEDPVEPELPQDPVEPVEEPVDVIETKMEEVAETTIETRCLIDCTWRAASRGERPLRRSSESSRTTGTRAAAFNRLAMR